MTCDLQNSLHLTKHLLNLTLSFAAFPYLDNARQTKNLQMYKYQKLHKLLPNQLSYQLAKYHNDTIKNTD